MPWHTWKHQPVAGDLIIVCSTRLLINIPYDWVQATQQVAYMMHHNPKSVDPVFSSYADGNEWYMAGYIAYETEMGYTPCLEESCIHIKKKQLKDL